MSEDRVGKDMISGLGGWNVRILRKNKEYGERVISLVRCICLVIDNIVFYVL